VMYAKTRLLHWKSKESSIAYSTWAILREVAGLGKTSSA
jgi:hypothetical protein